MQNSTVTQQQKVEDLSKLIASKNQRNFDHMFAYIPIFDGGEKEDFVWLENLEAVCLQNDGGIKVETLGRS